MIGIADIPGQRLTNRQWDWHKLLSTKSVRKDLTNNREATSPFVRRPVAELATAHEELGVSTFSARARVAVEKHALGRTSSRTLPPVLERPLRQVLPQPLQPLLQNFPDSAYVLHGLRHGFSLSPSSFPTESVRLPARKYSRDHLQAILQLLEVELLEGKIAGPFREPPFDIFLEHPIFLVDKPHATPPWRLIHDLSSPVGLSLNSFIPTEERVVKYPSVDLAADTILRLDSDRVYLAKTDISNAFRNLSVCPREFSLLVFAVEHNYYVDMRLPFGAGSSCRIYQRFSNALVYVVTTRHPSVPILALLDDHLFVGKTFDEVAEAQNFFHHQN